LSDAIHWGILGTGAIAKKFAMALQSLPDARLVAVGSRTQAKAEEFGAKYRVPHRCGSYESLVNDAEVEAVYVATPHSCHKENALTALAAGKPVLVEKPFTINAAEAESVIQVAREKKLLVMEAMWTRYLPLYVKLRKLLAEGAIGEVRMLTSDFGFKARPDSNPRLFEPALGGGALLDIGVYPVSLASMIFGPPFQVTGAAKLGLTCVDEQSAMTLKHARGQLAMLWCAITVDTPQEAALMGTEGRIRVHAQAWKGTTMSLIRAGGKEEVLNLPYQGNGYQFEAIEFMNCLCGGKLESSVMPLDETISIMKTLDARRDQWGLRYPME
jgi:predicted dehydrogenase